MRSCSRSLSEIKRSIQKGRAREKKHGIVYDVMTAAAQRIFRHPGLWPLIASAEGWFVHVTRPLDKMAAPTEAMSEMHIKESPSEQKQAKGGKKKEKKTKDKAGVSTHSLEVIYLALSVPCTIKSCPCL